MVKDENISAKYAYAPNTSTKCPNLGHFPVQVAPVAPQWV
jgi:hypothetical protein